MKKKVLFYVMMGEAMCAQHVLLNALDLIDNGHEAKIILEGQAVKLPQLLDGKNPLFERSLKEGLIAGVCKACSVQLGVLEYNQAAGLTILDDLHGHAGFRAYLEDGYEVIEF